MVSRTATVGGIVMRWEEQGEGLPLVLIHGLPTSPALWRHVLPRIMGAHCLAFEMVGYGASIPQGRGRDLSVGGQADYVASWLPALGIKSAVFAGHDLGGGVAQIAAVRYPGLCRGLFLTNTIGYDSWPVPSAKILRAAAPLVRGLPALAARQILRTLMYRGHDDRARAREALEVHWRPYTQHGGAESLIRQVRSLNVRDTLAVADAIPSLRIPARLVWGAADPFLKIRYGERFAHDLSASLYAIDRGRHFTPEDHPEIVAEEINRLLADVQQQA